MDAASTLLLVIVVNGSGMNERTLADQIVQSVINETRKGGHLRHRTDLISFSARIP